MQDFHDPRTELSFDPEIGQTFENRGEQWTIIYMDEEIVLLRSDEIHDRGMYHQGKHRTRTEDREYFERKCGSGEYELLEEGGAGGPLVTLKDRANEFADKDGRKAAHKEEAFREAIGLLTGDRNADDMEKVPFEELDGIGAKTASNLRQAEFITKRDIRNANDEKLLDVRGLGEKGLTSIREYV